MSDIVEEAKKKYTVAKDHWSAIYSAAREDLHFLSDKPGCQWDDREYEHRRRKGRPALQVDQLTQFVNQVSNDIRMNTPSINVIPHSGGADIETAEIFQGLIRDIEQNSNADDAYDYAVNSAIKARIGYFRVDHRYKDNQSFDQELYIERVVNPLSVFLDPSSVAPDGSDAKCCYILDEISVEEFKERYPKFSPVSFDGDGKEGDEDEKITICEYFEIKETPVTLAQLADGSIIEYEKGMPVQPVATREGTRKTVHRYHLSGQDVLDETTSPGDYIPVIPVYGEEAWIDGKRHLHSLIAKAKDPQRRYNYWASSEAEMLKKATKATFIAVGGTTENYAKDYTDPDNAIVLRYDQVDGKGNPAPPPTMNAGPQIPAGIVHAMQKASDDIKATLGLYNAFLGQQSNETSGVAIKQRKMEGDRAIYHFGDNLVRSITHLGRILVSAIPEIYSGPRIVSVIGKEEDSDNVGINGARVEGQEQDYFLDQGQYNVRVQTGASYATMRQEAAEFFQQVIQSQPALMQVAGDLMFKYMDFPGAQALSERMKKTIPPQLLDENVDDPQVVALQQENQQLMQALQTAQAELQSKQGELQVKVMAEQNDVQESAAKNEIEVAKLQLEQQKMTMEYEIKKAELELKAQELKAQELVSKEQMAVMAAQQAAQRPAANEMPQSGGYQPVGA